MTCRRFLDDVQAYALGALDAGDRARVGGHLDGAGTHEGCAEALAAALACVLSLDAALDPVAPGGDTWGRIEASIAPERAQRPRRRAWREAVPWGLALAAAVALLFVRSSWQRSEQGRRAAAQELARLGEVDAAREQCRAALDRSSRDSAEQRRVVALLGQAGTRVVAFQPQGGRGESASAVVDPSGGRAWLVTAALPAVPGKDYELWVIRGSQAPVPAGLVRAGERGAAVVEFDAKAMAGGTPSALAVSLEPEGGRPSPTEVILVAAL